MSAPYQPMDPASGDVASFALPAIANELMAGEVFQRSGRVARTLARGDGITAVLTVMKKNCEMHEHSAPGPVTVTVLSGDVTFDFGAPHEDVALSEGATVVFSKDAAHRVRAREDSAFLIVIGGRSDSHS